MSGQFLAPPPVSLYLSNYFIFAETSTPQKNKTSPVSSFSLALRYQAYLLFLLHPFLLSPFFTHMRCAFLFQLVYSSSSPSSSCCPPLWKRCPITSTTSLTSWCLVSSLSSFYCVFFFFGLLLSLFFYGSWGGGFGGGGGFRKWLCVWKQRRRM